MYNNCVVFLQQLPVLHWLGNAPGLVLYQTTTFNFLGRDAPIAI